MAGRNVKALAKGQLRRLFELGQRVGVDILPRHFYSSIPDIHELRHRSDWKQPRSLYGVRGRDLDAQVEFVARCTRDLQDQLRAGNIYRHACADNGAEGFGAIEADFLFCFIASHRPARVIQVGAGVSTSVILAAAAAAGYDVDLLCIDPFPNEFLTAAAKSRRIRLRAQPAQEVPLETLADLGPAGLFFVDSTHAVKPGSEVNYLVLEVLPRLAPGTVVHFHDITFPYDYPRRLLTTDLFFPSETALLLAFLTMNPCYEIRASLSMLHYGRPADLKAHLPNYQPEANDDGLHPAGVAGDLGHYPSSIYLEVVPGAT